MEIDTFTTILVAIVPAITSACAIVGGVIKIVSIIKKYTQNTENQLVTKLEKTTFKLEKAYSDISVLKNKVSSMEKLLAEKKDARL